MKIQNTISAQMKVETVQLHDKENPQNSVEKSNTANKIVEVVNISEPAKMNQTIDILFDRADEIYMSHITPQQKKELAESYQLLDNIFTKENPSEIEQKNVDKTLSMFLENILYRYL